MTRVEGVVVFGTVLLSALANAFFFGRTSGYNQMRELREQRVSELREQQRLCLALVDEMADHMDSMVTIPDCDCPGPEECDVEATCNRDAMRCCLALIDQQERP